MRIGLVRHFKVIHKLDRNWMTSDQFNAWVEAYNNAEIEDSDLDYGFSEWDVCISSDLPSADGRNDIPRPYHRNESIKRD